MTPPGYLFWERVRSQTEKMIEAGHCENLLTD